MFVLSALVSASGQSFRFGPEIAYVAALVLDVLKHERRQTLVGGSQPGDVWGLHDDGPIAVIARTNAGLFGEMALVADRASRSRTCIRIGFAGVRLCHFCLFIVCVGVFNEDNVVCVR